MNIDSIQLISNADIVITTDSTMAFDALFLNKPVISINFKEHEKYFIYKDVKPIKKVSNQKELETAIKQSKTQTSKNLAKIKKYLGQEFFKLDGKSAQRTADFIKSLLLTKKKNAL